MAPVEIHPAGATIPENLLRIELRFGWPQPMPFDVRRLTLLDASDREIPGALLDLTLPSADGRRLTVLMDPGRIKQGVGPNLDAGRALRAGDTVRLRVDGFGGHQPSVVKTWHVTPAVTTRLDTARWRMTAPRAGSREPLLVDLQAPISSTGEALIAVRDASGRRVEGRTSLGHGDTQWRFTPDRPWRKSAYELVTHPDLEDPAGNRSCAAFEQRRASEVRCDSAARAPRPLTPR
ncbi:hypothetical protein [Roseateles chitosanitabidus]|uniref:hypothetical protein n=1 Tax=Roseateles chitosanitabidus TaxID=65048 RepID=UPI0008357554|nr:hypothetical protein [Roseateles chitosanitabidus]